MGRTIEQTANKKKKMRRDRENFVCCLFYSPTHYTACTCAAPLTLHAVCVQNTLFCTPTPTPPSPPHPPPGPPPKQGFLAIFVGFWGFLGVKNMHGKHPKTSKYRYGGGRGGRNSPSSVLKSRLLFDYFRALYSRPASRPPKKVEKVPCGALFSGIPRVSPLSTVFVCAI